MMLDLDQPQERPLQVAKALASTLGLLHSLTQVLAPPDSDFHTERCRTVHLATV